MSKHLVIVESPAKAKTIKRYLGKDFEVLASYGHVRDLIPKEGAVDPNNNFDMTYQAVERSKPNIQKIEKSLANADSLWLATDPDREGEAIAWHLCELLRGKRRLVKKSVSRVVFHEITKTAIKHAVEHPREINMDLVNAQQARRALDYLVGFNLSPLLWRKIRPGLSAGRVQSPALRMIVEREEAIEAFKSREYWSITSDLAAKKQKFTAKLTHYQQEKLEQFSIVNDKQANKAKEDLLKAANGELVVVKVDKKKRKRNPAPPFITSTLQQEAARKLGFTAQRTMRAAQQLYEAGLITYMRTDSTNLAKEAVDDLRSYIEKNYDEYDLPKEPRVFKAKSKNAQEAHEAIRPTLIFNTIEKIKLDDADQTKLYSLIWKRTLASQMSVALIDMVAVDLSAGDAGLFRANGSSIAQPGFMRVYLEEKDDDKGTEDKENLLPVLKEGDRVTLNEVITNQHFTEPPPRFTEASLIKSLEEHDIGRPSTYASIIATLKNREYVTIDQKRFYPTDVGRVVNKFLTNYFAQYVDYNFTAKLEDELDEVARGEKAWIPLLEHFWSPFKTRVDDTMENVKRSDVVQEKIDEKCPKCGKDLAIRLGRNGRFIGCSGFPDCDYTRSIGDDSEGQVNEGVGRDCPDCNKPLVFKHGRYGKFIGCSGYPDCRHIEPLNKPKDTEVACPKCKKGTMLERKSRKGKLFYSCSGYPECKYAVWNEPLNISCPKCHWPMLTKKVSKRAGEQKVCPQADCDYVEDLGDNT
ncbi:MAG: DNA topoisomerase I [Legionellaceae bacterium]|nr:DNA topoisomerase I [Legionellaceae bacterium]